jgi:hypothetical protein
MTRVYLLTFVLGVLLSSAPVCVEGQESTPPDLSTPQARAYVIREAVIETYGTPAIISAYHALQSSLTHPFAGSIVIPSQPTKKRKSKSDTTVLESGIYSEMDESGLFVSSFSFAMLTGLEQPPKTSSEALAPARQVAHSLLFNLFDTVAGSIPYMSLVMETAGQRATKAAADAAAQELEFNRNSRRGAMHMAEAKALVAVVLSEDDRNQYEEGDLMVKASLLFKAAHETLEKQELPNAYVLWMVDGQGADGVKSHLAREQFSVTDPSNQNYQVTTWDGLPELEKWKVATDSLRVFMERGERALASPGSDPQMGRLIAGSLSGAEGESVLKAVGLEEYTKWKSASDEQKKRIAAGAAGIEAGMDLVMPILIGDNRIATHAIPPMK